VREARIATVRHQRTAPVARMWEVANLQSACQMHLAGSVQRKVTGGLAELQHLGTAATAHGDVL
jgi:hypothetical protein